MARSPPTRVRRCPVPGRPKISAAVITMMTHTTISAGLTTTWEEYMDSVQIDVDEQRPQTRQGSQQCESAGWVGA